MANFVRGSAIFLYQRRDRCKRDALPTELSALYGFTSLLTLFSQPIPVSFRLFWFNRTADPFGSWHIERATDRVNDSAALPHREGAATCLL